MHVKRPLNTKKSSSSSSWLCRRLALDFGDFDVLAVEGSHDVGVQWSVTRSNLV